MSEPPNPADKPRETQRGRPWRKGESGNPAGMRKGTKHKLSRTIHELVRTNAPEIVKGIIKDAKEGDAEARKLFLRLLPQMPRNTEPIEVRRPESIEQIRQLAGDLVVQVLSRRSRSRDREDGRRTSAITEHRHRQHRSRRRARGDQEEPRGEEVNVFAMLREARAILIEEHARSAMRVIFEAADFLTGGAAGFGRLIGAHGAVLDLVRLEAGEEYAGFRARLEARAEAEGARFVLIGGIDPGLDAEADLVPPDAPLAPDAVRLLDGPLLSAAPCASFSTTAVRSCAPAEGSGSRRCASRSPPTKRCADASPPT